MKIPLNQRLTDYVTSHKISLSIFVASYGAFFLTVVIMSNWSIAYWGLDTFNAPAWAVQPLIHRSCIGPFFFVTSVPALIIGTIILSESGVNALRRGSVIDQPLAIVLTIFGFAYQIIGAWPLQSVVDLPWLWQKQIMSFGVIFAWGLYVLSWIVLAVGAFSLYVHSKNYRLKHPDFDLLNE